MRSKPSKKRQPTAAEQPPENPNLPKSPMEKLRALVMEVTMNSTSNKSLSAAQKNLVRQKLVEFFPDSKSSPDHPPYSWMILKAIENLNEEGGSSEEAISQYIVKQHSNLPWAHAALLPLHLGKLRESNEIFEPVDGRYSVSIPVANPNDSVGSKKKKDSNNKKGETGEEQNPMHQNDQQQGQEEPTDSQLDVPLLALKRGARKAQMQQPKSEKGKRKPGRKSHTNVPEELTNVESEVQPLELDDAQNKNGQIKQLKREQTQVEGKKRQTVQPQNLQLQPSKPNTKSSEGLSVKPTVILSFQLRERKQKTKKRKQN